MLFGASFPSVSAFRKAAAADSRHNPNGKSEAGRLRSHAMHD